MFIGQPDLAAPAAPTSSVETGLIVLSMDGRILHTNDRAHEFARHFTNEPRRLQAPATTPLRHPLMDLFHDVLANLEKHIAAEDWSQFEITRLARWGGGTVRLRGFGIPDQAKPDGQYLGSALQLHTISIRGARNSGFRERIVARFEVLRHAAH